MRRIDDQFEDDLSEFKWEVAKQQSAETEAEEEDIAEEINVDDLLGGFLSSMNK